MVSDEREVGVGHTTFVTSRAGLTKEVVFHEGGLSKGVLLYFHTSCSTVCMYVQCVRMYSVYVQYICTVCM